MEINCPSCYTLIDDEENNCPNCGTTLKKSKPGNLKLIVVLSIIIMLLLTSYLIIIATQRIDEEQQPKGIEIDGKFNDWNNVAAVDDANEVMPFNTNVDILECRVNSSQSELSFYLRVEGDMLAGEPDGERHVDTVYIFIDTDQSPYTGYFIEGIGTDYMVEVYGWNGAILDERLFSYTSEQQDWNLWEQVGSASAAVSGSELEVQVDYDTVGLGNHDTIDVIFYIQSWDGFEDFSDSVLGNEIGVLLVTQQGIGDDVISGFGNRLLRLEIEALNADITINELRVNRIGVGSDGDISGIRLEQETGQSIGTGTINDGLITFQPSFNLANSESRVLFIVVDISLIAVAENSIGFRIMNNHDIVIDRGTVSLTRIKPNENSNDNSYLLSVPENITIDGAFADWNDKTIRNDTTMDVNREDLDMLRYGVSSTDSGPVFYLSVDGEIGSGVKVPFWNTRTESDTTMDDDSFRTGEDIIYIFIDTINDTGYNDNLPIGADYLIEVRGRYNVIISSSYYEWSGTEGADWDWSERGTVEVGLDMDEMEIGIDWDDIGVDPVNDRFSVYFLITDWEERASDYSDGEGTIEGPKR